MKVYGVSAYDIERTVELVSARAYDGNVVIKSSEDRSNSAGPRATFTIRVLNGAAGQPGAIGATHRTGTGPNGRRRGIAACWHAHWDVIEELLARFPAARVVSGIQLHGRNVQYTAATFRDTALKTAHLNTGNCYEPVTMPQCCECDHSRYTSTPASVDPSLTGQYVPPGIGMVATPQRPDDNDDFLTDDDDTDDDTEGADTGDPYRYSRAANAQAIADAQASVGYHGDNRFSPDTGRAYLDGLPPAQPWTKYGSATVDRTIGDIDKVLDE